MEDGLEAIHSVRERQEKIRHLKEKGKKFTHLPKGRVVGHDCARFFLGAGSIWKSLGLVSDGDCVFGDGEERVGSGACTQRLLLLLLFHHIRIGDRNRRHCACPVLIQMGLPAVMLENPVLKLGRPENKRVIRDYRGASGGCLFAVPSTTAGLTLLTIVRERGRDRGEGALHAASKVGGTQTV